MSDDIQRFFEETVQRIGRGENYEAVLGQLQGRINNLSDNAAQQLSEVQQQLHAAQQAAHQAQEAAHQAQSQAQAQAQSQAQQAANQAQQQAQTAQQQVQSQAQLISTLQSDNTSVRSQLSKVQSAQQAASSSTRTPTPPPTPQVVKNDLKLEHVAMFDGTPQKLRRWGFQIRQYCSHKGWNTSTGQTYTWKNEAGLYAASRLSGKAVTWWEAECNKDTSKLRKVDLEDLFVELQDQFRDVDYERRLMHKFDSIKQTRDVASYTHTFRHLITELGSLVTDYTAIQRYQQGLRDDIRVWVMMDRSNTTLSDMYFAAERAEQTLRGHKLAYKPQQQPKKVDHTTPMDIDAMFGQNKGQNNKKGKSLFGGNSSQSTQRGNPNNRGARGRGRGQGGQYTGRGNAKNKSFKCYYCGKPGHYARDCWKNPQNHLNHAEADFPTPLPPPPQFTESKNQ